MTNYISKMKKIIRDQRSEYEFIDTEDSTRIHKYVRMKSNKYKILKKWHFVFNEYGMSGILRDFIVFFYNGIVKYGEAKFLEIISKKMNYDKIIKRIKILATHMNDYFVKNRILYSYIVEDLLFFSQ